MPRRRGLFLAFSLLCPALLSAGCAQPIDAPDATAYVLLDPAARARWTVASDGWQGAPILPVALDVEETAALRGPEGAQRIALRGGMLAHVRGAEGEIRWLARGAADAPPGRVRGLHARGPLHRGGGRDRRVLGRGRSRDAAIRGGGADRAGPASG
ncbi:hypothetical protein [Sorangium sp. So ce363]|uniref:hypothetical protein n=1 Tax=Sorangium sp. So ce363 TaxID=3133304 RepID=UPI003F6440A6